MPIPAHKTHALRAAMSQAAPLLDNIVFSAIKKGFGGRLRFVVSGGAPLGSSVQEFLQIVLCCPILQGYGLTETCGPVSRQLHAASSRMHAHMDDPSVPSLRNSFMQVIAD